MIQRISTKRSGPSGQLDEICHDVGFTLMTELPLFDFFKKIQQNEDYRPLLIYNQLQNIYQIIDFARHSLIFSSENLTKEFCRKFLKTVDIDSLEMISSYYLSTSIMCFNASFDYIRVLIWITYASIEDLKKSFPIDKTINEIQRQKLHDIEWPIAFFSLISKQQDKNNKKAENLVTSGTIKRAFRELCDRNEVLRKKYFANSLKHSVFPYYKRSNNRNVIGAHLQISLEQFYGKTKNKQIIFGLPKAPLTIDDLQSFLIEYNNGTVRVVNLIIENIPSSI